MQPLWYLEIKKHHLQTFLANVHLEPLYFAGPTKQNPVYVHYFTAPEDYTWIQNPQVDNQWFLVSINDTTKRFYKMTYSPDNFIPPREWEIQNLATSTIEHEYMPGVLKVNTIREEELGAERAWEAFRSDLKKDNKARRLLKKRQRKSDSSDSDSSDSDSDDD